MRLSYRRRLTLFFVLIVVLPMVALSVLVVDISEESNTGKADARLGADLEVALSVYDEATADSREVATELARDPGLAAALRAGDPAAVEQTASRLAAERDLSALRVTDPDGRTLAAIDEDAVAPGEVELRSPDGADAGTLVASTTTAEGYVDEVERLTGEGVTLLDAKGAVLAETVPTEDLDLPQAGEAGDVEVGGDDARAVGGELPGSDSLRLALIGPAESGGFLASSPGVAVALVAFFALALVFVEMLRRALGDQVTQMLGAARRIGEGDFTRRVPVEGQDEMAGLASEFNKMTDRLSEQMSQLRRQRVEIERSVQRIGEAFASGLDRQALLGVVCETAVAACEADYGLIAVSGQAGAEAESGAGSTEMQEVALTAEERALRTGEVATAEADGAHALACPLLRVGPSTDPIGAMAIARDDRAFTSDEHDVFRYLLGQAAASVENIGLHELVTQQAVTDELTGLGNKRSLREWLDRETARAARFSRPLSLLMVDLDDFKRVNDAHGHLQGDDVLRTVARILNSEARAVDHRARYGGEEFVVAMPETGVDGALELAERIRGRIEAEPMAKLAGGAEIRITASVGTATLPDAAQDARGLVATADQALYAAKRAGKNRVVVAPSRRSTDGRGGRSWRSGRGRSRPRGRRS